MAIIGTLVSFSAGTTIVSADVNSNFSAIRNAFNNSAVLNDTANTITVTHTFTVGQVFSGITATAITLSGTNGITLSTAASRIVPGATSMSLRNNANSADNLILTDAGAATIRAGATITAGGLQITAGNLAFAIAPLTYIGHYMPSNLALTGNAAQRGSYIGPTADSGATSSFRGTEYALTTQASAVTYTQVAAVYVNDTSKGAGGTITTQYGMFLNAMSAGATNYGIQINQGAVAGNAIRISQTAAMVDDAIKIHGGSLTGSDAKSLLNLTQTWNTSGAPDGILLDVTNTASTGAKLINLKVGGASKFSIDVSGNLTQAGSFSPSTIALATSATVGGVAISIAADTTTGFYSAGTGILDVAVSGTRIASFNINAGTPQFFAQGNIKIAAITGQVICQVATLATNATTGFLYIPTMAATGSGAAGAQTGCVALAYDTTGNRIQVYSGAWRSVAVA